MTIYLTHTIAMELTAGLYCSEYPMLSLGFNSSFLCLDAEEKPG
jgi:hypothetical protein